MAHVFTTHTRAHTQVFIHTLTPWLMSLLALLQLVALAWETLSFRPDGRSNQSVTNKRTRSSSPPQVAFVHHVCQQPVTATARSVTLMLSAGVTHTHTHTRA